MNAACRNCGAHIPEEEAFCPKCGAVMESNIPSRAGNVDASWDIPETLLGQRPPATSKSKPSAAGGLSANKHPVANKPPVVTRTPQAQQTDERIRAQTEAESAAPPHTPPDARGNSLKLVIIGFVAVLIIGALLALFISRS